ncbi:DUF2793 domain-containing protein [Bosea sp. (in: a-proteobacteria)]|uniref:DUF2793 domain-containing protein n=1 Tax=Bosea sp. (in: a-proteobacteria) TaxID=1871050 RepID=UPI00261A2BA2|nr:DUF2793 domain-containing protein [Bosea sp. (in: a-proteobacteria)]MCO5091548.1 DUF2793 domain-containing protein [Bosea sp. (in: a-proteobacteria)]
MSDTSRLNLPLLAAGQAQKHVTHNDALTDLDALVQLSVVARDMLSPPPSPAEGGIWLLGATPLDEWAGRGGKLAERRDGGWIFHAPRAGWIVWVEDEQVLLVHDGADWRGVLDGGAPAQLTRLGLATTADAANPFAAKLNKALWTALTTGEGGDGDLRFTLDKEATGNVLSLLFQSGYSGRAEIGLVGDDDLGFRVSSDGSLWQEALRIAAGGAVSFPSVGTTAAAANAVLDSGTGNALLRSTSSRRYKRDIQPLAPEVADRVLALSPVRYRSAAVRDRAEWSWYGLLAEDVAAVDPRLVHWTDEDEPSEGEDGARRLRPDAVQYDRLSVLLIDVVRRQRAAIDGLTARIAALEGRFGSLAG